MRIIFTIFILAAIILGIFTYTNKLESKKNADKTDSNSTSKTTNIPIENYKAQRILFVPYWTLNSKQNIEDFDTLAYFGITANENGVDLNDSGYKNIQTFKKVSQSKKVYLVVRMLDSGIINEILQSSNSRKRVIEESLKTAKENNFSGIILDMEFKALAFESVIKSVTDFYKEFYNQSHKNNLEFSSLIYGDVVYRGRPYDVEAIGEYSDRIYIMAYDFSKAGGDPGPNFPFEDYDKYGYDFKTLVSDFSKMVQYSKLVTVFGMFGYEWTIDEKGRGKGSAQPKTTYQGETLLESCIEKTSCKVDKSDGIKISYGSEGVNYELWFEDQESVNKKIIYLNSKGLESVGYWANSFWNSELIKE